MSLALTAPPPFVARRHTVAEVEALPDGERFELVDGELVEREMALESVYTGGKIFRKFDEHCDANPIAVALTDGASYTLRAGNDLQLRRPDVSVVLRARLPVGPIFGPRIEFAPDLAVEVVSRQDVYWDIDEKIRDYLHAGTAVVWLARPAVRRIVVFRPDGSETSFGPADEISAGPVLPELKFRVADVFQAPLR